MKSILRAIRPPDKHLDRLLALAVLTGLLVFVIEFAALIELDSDPLWRLIYGVLASFFFYLPQTLVGVMPFYRRYSRSNSRGKRISVVLNGSLLLTAVPAVLVCGLSLVIGESTDMLLEGVASVSGLAVLPVFAALLFISLMVSFGKDKRDGGASAPVTDGAAPEESRQRSGEIEFSY